MTSLPRLLPRRLSANGTVVAIVAAGAGLAFGLGWLSNPGQDAGILATQAVRNDWRDLRPRSDNSAADLAVLRARAPWGTSAVDPAAAAAAAAAASAAAGAGGGLGGTSGAVTWRVTGVARIGDRFLAVLTLASNGQAAKSSFLQVGDKLPDGRTLVAIDAASVEVDTNGSRQRIRLYWPKS